MATESVLSEMISHAAWILDIGGKDPFLKSDQTIDEFEYGAWRI